MTGYRRIKSSHPNEPSSDFIDSSSQDQRSQEPKTHRSHLEQETGDAQTDKISGSGAPKLHRNASSSSPSLVKRAFSYPRSSSSSERYCKIHDQQVILSSPPDDQEVDQSFSNEKKSVRGRILKSCKRIFGL